ncbi:MAG: SusF/SusE family outer membrane protein [Bacteroidales bacterium]
MNKIKYLLIIIMTAFIYSCAEDDIDNPPAPLDFDNAGPVLIDTIDNQNAVLLKQNESMAWDTLAWEPAVLYEGQGLVTHYAIQMDEQGNDFTSLFEISPGTTSDTSIVITVGMLNAKLLENGYSPLDTFDLELRVKAYVHPDLEAVYSDVHPFSITTYKDIAVPDELYLFGDATAVGWGADTSLAMFKDGDVFVKYAYLENGMKFRFLKAQNTEDNTYNSESLINLSDNVDEANDEEKNFLFTGATGWYRIEADYLTSNLNITEHISGAETYTYDYPSLYMVGEYNSTDGVWDAINAAAFTRVSEGLYTIEKQLQDGAVFKFIGQQDWGDLEWGNIKEDGNTGIIGPKDFNGDITFDGGDKTYEITVDLKQGLYSFTEIPTLPTELYMIGDGVGDWEWANTDLPMIPVHSHPELFWKIVWMNETGAFKIAPEKDWGNDFGYDTDLGNGEYSIGGTNVPVPGTEGYYMVVVDLENNLISVTEPEVYLIGNTVGSWDTADPNAKFTVDNVNEVITITKDLAADEIRMYAWHSYFTDWWQSEFMVLNNTIEFRGNGNDQERVNVNAGSNTVELNFRTGVGSIIENF